MAMLPMLIGLSSCSSQQRLPAATCNGLIDQWNKDMRRYAAYRQQIDAFRNLVAATKPTTSAKQVLVAKISPDFVDAVLTKPNIDTLPFAVLPSVQLHLNDLETDLATFATKVEDTKMANLDGSWGTVPDPVMEGAVKRLLAFDSTPGLSAASAFDSEFKSPLSRMTADYSAAPSSMREEYKIQCDGDPNEVRSVSDF
jgi:hypothetical protein